MGPPSRGDGRGDGADRSDFGDGVGVDFGILALMVSSSALALLNSGLSGPRRLIAFCMTVEEFA